MPTPVLHNKSSFDVCFINHLIIPFYVLSGVSVFLFFILIMLINQTIILLHVCFQAIVHLTYTNIVVLTCPLIIFTSIIMSIFMNNIFLFLSLVEFLPLLTLCLQPHSLPTFNPLLIPNFSEPQTSPLPFWFPYHHLYLCLLIILQVRVLSCQPCLRLTYSLLLYLQSSYRVLLLHRVPLISLRQIWTFVLISPATVFHNRPSLSCLLSIRHHDSTIWCHIHDNTSLPT